MQDPSRPVTGYPAPNGCPPPQPGTAYPYAAPPPPQHQPPYYYNNNNNNPYSYRSPSFFRRFLAAMLVLFVVGGVIIFVLWLVLRPRIPDFQVDSLSLSNFSLSNSSSITGNWNVRFSVTNPNKKLSLAYDDVYSSIFYKRDLVSQTRIPPFKQQKRNRTVVDASFSATDTYVDTWVVNSINGDRTRGTVNFNVKVMARVVFRAGGWRARNRILRVWCLDLSVGVSANRTGSGNLVGGPKECSVGL